MKLKKMCSAKAFINMLFKKYIFVLVSLHTYSNDFIFKSIQFNMRSCECDDEKSFFSTYFPHLLQLSG